MDIATVSGISGGLIIIVAAFIIGGNDIMGLVNVPSVVVVIFGSFAGVMASGPLSKALGFTKYLNIALRVPVFQNKMKLLKYQVLFFI